MRIKRLLFATIVSVMLTATSAFAIPITWSLQNAVFGEGATATGSFTYDVNTDTYSAWNISVTAGTFPAFNYNPSVSFVGVHSSNAVDFVENVGASVDRYIRLAFSTPLTNAGGLVSLDLVSSYECNNCDIFRRFTSGSVTSTAVPEPSSPAAASCRGRVPAGKAEEDTVMVKLAVLLLIVLGFAATAH